MSEPYLLLVEDNEDDTFLTLRTLQRHGFPAPVKTVRDGVEALSFLEGASTLPVAVLLNSQLPRLNGEEVIALLRGDRRTEDLSILLLTGSEEERQRLCGKGAKQSTRADACLSKPLRWLACWRAMRQLGLETFSADAAALPSTALPNLGQRLF